MIKYFINPDTNSDLLTRIKMNFSFNLYGSSVPTIFNCSGLSLAVANRDWRLHLRQRYSIVQDYPLQLPTVTGDFIYANDIQLFGIIPCSCQLETSSAPTIFNCSELLLAVVNWRLHLCQRSSIIRHNLCEPLYCYSARFYIF